MNSKLLLRTLTLAALVFVSRATAGPIVSVAETGGDGTVTAKFTGQTFTGTGQFPAGSYTAPPFGGYARAYVDRAHAYTNASGTVLIPSYLAGNDYILNRNENRDNTGFRLDVTVSQDVFVYLLIDNRLGEASPVNSNPPFGGAALSAWPSMQWVHTNGFLPALTGQNRSGSTSVPDEVGIDEGANGGIENFFSVYSNRFNAGVIRLYQQGLAGNNMYGVVIAPAPPTSVPAAPTNIVVVNGDAAVSLTWNTVNGATNYFVKRASTSGGPYTTVASQPGTSFTDNTVVNGSTYYYVVSGENALGEGTNSTEVIGTPNVVVTGLAAVGATGTVSVTWSALPGGTSYTVRRAVASSGPFSDVATGLTETQFTDTSVQNGRTYFYRVEAALTGGGTSGQSATVSATTAPATVPVLSASLYASRVSRLSWTADPEVAQFILENSTDGQNFTSLANLTGAQRTYTNTGLTLGTTNYYRVRAQNSSGTSAFSGVASVVTPALGYNVNFANTNAATPVGYVQDVGEVFGPRTNGLTYGWVNAAGTNIMVDGRLRNSPNSPDLRFDTFNHMQKSVGGALWEIELPNGYYRIRIVAGDPTATDSVFQHNIEGVVTPTYQPVTGAWWSDITTNFSVTDGRLTIANGPSASNNKINFVDIYSDVPTPPSFATQPQSITTEEYRNVALSPVVAGSPNLIYQWFFNDQPVTTGTNRVLSLPRIRTASAGSYYLIVTNFGGAATSDVVTVTVTPDPQPPTLISAGSLDGRTIGICFDEEIDVTSVAATEPGNFQVNGGLVSVTNVTVRPDGRSLQLHLLETISGPFTVDALDIPDYANNSTVSSITGFSLGYTAQDIGSPQSPGGNFTCDSQSIEVTGGGADVWGVADQAYLATKSLTGNFDISVRVDSLRGADPITKAVLVARETLNADSRSLHVSVNPPLPQRNQFEMGYRPTNGATTVLVGGASTNANIPAWMRLSRVGDTFTSFRSSNGVDWVVIASTNVVFPSEMHVGFGLTAHNNSLLATGLFSNLTVSQESSANLAVSATASTNQVRLGGHVNIVVSITNHGPDTAANVFLTNALFGGNGVSATPSQGTISGFSSSGFVWNVGSLSAGAVASVNVFASASVVGTLTNRSAVVSSTFDPALGNNTADILVTVLPPQNPTLSSAGATNGTFFSSFLTESNLTYEVQYTDEIRYQFCPGINGCPEPPPQTIWNTLTNIAGDGTLKSFIDPTTGQKRFYRVLVR